MAYETCFIYLSKVNCPFYTTEMQEKFCRDYCAKNQYTDVTVLKDDDDTRTKLKDFIFKPSDCNYFITFSFSCLGENVDDITTVIKVLLEQDIKIITLKEPPILTLASTGWQGEKMLLAASLSNVVYENMFWKRVMKENLL